MTSLRVVIPPLLVCWSMTPAFAGAGLFRKPVPTPIKSGAGFSRSCSRRRIQRSGLSCWLAEIAQQAPDHCRKLVNGIRLVDDFPNAELTRLRAQRFGDVTGRQRDGHIGPLP